MVLGIWLMAAPAVLGYGGAAETNDRIVGPLAASFAIIAVGEATRDVRRVNLVLAAWLLVAPWVLGYPSDATVNATLAAILLGALSFVRGRVRERFGRGWRVLISGYPGTPQHLDQKKF